MKTNTITFHSAHNYGAVLQAYALQKTLVKLGYDNEIIDIDKTKESLFRPINISLSKKCLSLIKYNLIVLLQYKKLHEKFKKFESFINDYLTLTKKFGSINSLQSEPPQADIYIAGSDQVWNCTNGCFTPFLLDFGDNNAKRVSYAASLGSYDIPEAYLEQFRQLLARFDVISVREQEAKIFIENLLQRECCVHIDPVFLLSKDDWSNLCSNYSISYSKYILCYALLYNEHINEAAQKLKQVTGYPVVAIVHNAENYVKGDIYVYDAGPRDFLALMKNAEYVLTTSFHGTAFPIVFNRKFYSFISSKNPSRITNLLKCLGLESRLVYDSSNLNYLEGIDYKSVSKRIDQERESSYNYLMRFRDEQN